MNTSNRHKLPEEIELEQKRAELAALCAQHATVRAALQQVRDEISEFERMYERTLGRRLAELDRIEEEIACLTGFSSSDSCHSESAQDQRSQQHSSQQRASSGNSSGAERDFGRSAESAKREDKGDDKEIKALYREVAKAIHPDLAGSASGESERHELMARANRAYAQQDRRALEEILRRWRPMSAPAPSGHDIASDLIRAIRQIAREREDIQSVNTQVAELKGSYVYRFKRRVDENRLRGNDLFAEMVAAAEHNIERARKRLALLKGEVPKAAARQQDATRREICFPVDHFSGTLYLRDRASLNFSQWKKFGPAQGCLQVEADKAVRLDVKADAAVKLSQLREIKPDALQSLFLYEVCDSDLESILHLTGLEELYLSGPRLTDVALSRVASLSNLQRIYLYQTVITDRGLFHLHRLPGLKGLTSSGNSITDEGLAVFQKAIPGVKTVSFPWRR